MLLAHAAPAAGAVLSHPGLIQRPRLLLCGPEGAGQAHLGPALLYALEGLPIHAIGLPSLLADAGAR
jgi:SpoVK/Ycf46/Vps4 family AAA+-type ATPase